MKVTKEIVMELRIVEEDGFFGADLAMDTEDGGALFFGAAAEFKTPEKAVKRLFKAIAKDKDGICEICNFAE